MAERKRRRKRRRVNAVPIMCLIFLGLVAGCVAMLYINKFAPTKETMPLEDYLGVTEENELGVILDGRIAEKNEDGTPLAYSYQGRALVTLDYLKSQLDDRYYFDTNENILRYTTPVKINSVSAGENCYYAAGEKVDLSYVPFLVIDEKVCVDTEFVEKFSPVTCDVYSNRVVFYNDGFVKNFYITKKKTQLRRFGGPKSPILAEIAKGTRVAIIEDYDNWCYVISENGEIGCIKSSTIKKNEQVYTVAENEKFDVTHMDLGRDLSVGYYQTTNQIANGYMEGSLEGLSNVNVICPTWYCMSDNAGGIRDISSKELVDVCHARGYQVWPLFSNFEISSVDDVTVFSTTSLREAMIKKVIASIVACGADGITLDFESIPKDAADSYIELVREMALACKQNNLVFSVNNYVPQPFNAFYNIEEQAKFSDYIILMAYDEHTTGSEEAGSNASLPFVRDGIVNTLEKVPAEQVILSLPLYGRAFYQSGGKLSCSSISIKNMEELKSHFSYTWLDDLGQNYMEYTSDDVDKELWIEDRDSLKLKFDLIKEYDLAGAAYWKLGFETPYVWELAGEYLNADKF